MSRPEKTSRQVMDDMIAYVEDKYQEEFTMETVILRTWENPTEEYLTAKPAGEDENRSFRIKRYEEDGQIKFADGYVGYRMAPMIAEEFTALIEEVFPESIIRVQFPEDQLYPEEMPLSIDYAEFKSYFSRVHRLFASVIIPLDGESPDSDRIDRFKKKMIPAFPLGGLALFGVSRPEFEQILKKEAKLLSPDTVFDRLDREHRDLIKYENYHIRWGSFNFEEDAHAEKEVK